MWRGDGVCAQLVVQLCSQRAHGTANLRRVVFGGVCARGGVRDGCKRSPYGRGRRKRTLTSACQICVGHDLEIPDKRGEGTAKELAKRH